MMKFHKNFVKKSYLTASIFILFLGKKSLDADSYITASQIVTYTIDATSGISVSGDPAPMEFTCLNTTSGTETVIDTSTTYNVITNQAVQIITAQLDSNIPTGLILILTLTAPSGATSSPVTLNNTNQTAVSGISNLYATDLQIEYRLTANVNAPIGAITRTVTLTIGS